MSGKPFRLLMGDCLDLMRDLPDSSVDMIAADLPYGTTYAEWDKALPMPALWAQYQRVIKGNGAIVLTASQPFTSLLVTSTPSNALAVTGHTVDTLTRLRKHQLVYPFLAYFAVETVRVIRVVARHDGFVENGQSAHIAAVRAVSAHGRDV